MDVNSPLVSIIMPSFNRAHTIERAIDSVLNQSYKNIELIIINDGSTDNTLEILNKKKSKKIIVYNHNKNKGVTAAKNTGLNHIRGEWFTILDSDDEIVPGAIETMLKVPLFVDKTVTAITCNCLDTTTNQFSGKGLMHDQYININTQMTVCKGEFWGIAKTSLLQNDRFNEKIAGFENILWYKIDDRAKRYYIHEALRIYHTEGNDRITKTKYSFNKEVILYENLFYEDNFLNKIKIYYPQEYFSICKNGVITLRASNRKEIALKYYDLSREINKSLIIYLSFNYKVISIILKKYKIFKSYVRRYINAIKKRSQK